MKKIFCLLTFIVSFFFFNNVVKADETSFSISRDGNNSFSYQSYTFKNKVFDYTFDDDFISYSSPIKMSFYYYRESNKFDNYIIFRNTKLNTYFVYIAIAPISLYTDSDNYYYIKENLTSTTSYNFTNIIMFSADSDLESKLLSESGQSFSFHEHVINDDLKFYSAFEIQKNSSSSLILNTDYKIVDTNIEDLKINDKKWNENDLNNYEIIDMDVNNAVLFWPKDFRKLNPDCEAKDALVGALANCLFNYDNIFYLVGRYAVAMTDLEMSFNAYQLDFTSTYYTEFTPFSIKTSIFKHQGIIFYSNPIDPLTGLYLTNMKIAYDPELFNYKIIHDLDEQESFDIEYTDENGEVKQTTIVGIPKQDSVPDGSNYKYEINENSFDNLDLVDYLNDFFSKIIKGLNFFKTQLLMFSNNIPSLVFSFIIVIPILLFIFLLMRWF